MTTQFFSLPLEVRLEIYFHLFGTNRVNVQVGNSIKQPTFLPEDAIQPHTVQRSSQILRTCSALLYEARPVLYKNTTFHVINHTFAGKLPMTLSNGHPCATHAKHLLWQLYCDMMKHFYEDDFQMTASEFAHVDTVEVRCQSETWRGSYCGDFCDRAKFLKSRDGMLRFAKKISEIMAQSWGKTPRIVEDQIWTGRGMIIFKIKREHSQPLRLGETEFVV